jgi:hypothetical protein
MMLELLMTRHDETDRRVIENCRGLDFLVLDELHTYRGRQGADVALLVRRVREALSEQLTCIGTSATMTSEGTALSRAQAVADVASRLFGKPVDPAYVITETLERATAAELRIEHIKSALAGAIDAGVPESITPAALRAHPVAVWVELTLGLVDEEGKWIRAKPRSLSDAARQLSEDSGRRVDTCRSYLEAFLLLASNTRETADAPAFFAVNAR